MLYQISFRPAALRQMAKLPKAAQKSLQPKIEALKKNPKPLGVEHLKGGAEFYRLRVGQYRVIYQIKESELVVLVVRVGHRREVYKKLSRLS